MTEINPLRVISQAGSGYSGLVKTLANKDEARAVEALKLLEGELGESVLYRATGRFLGAGGLGTVPVETWGLVVLTPTRILFRHFPQAHPLFGGKDDEVRFELGRDPFDTCQAQLQRVWIRLFSGARDVVALTGPGVWLHLDLADDLRNLPRVWNASTRI